MSEEYKIEFGHSNIQKFAVDDCNYAKITSLTYDTFVTKIIVFVLILHYCSIKMLVMDEYKWQQSEQ